MNFINFRKSGSMSIQLLRVLVLIAIIGLASVIYFYPIRNQVPPGADSSVYVNDVRWILENHRLPKPNEALTHGIQAYPSPGTDFVVTSIVLLTGLPVITAFAWYQLLLIILLFFTSYLVGQLYSKRIALFSLVALLGCFALYRLYIGSTVSNLMAFSIINLIFYFSIVLSRATRKIFYVAVLALLFILLYLFHSYLTAPIFIGAYAAYFIFLTLTKSEFRTHVSLFIRRSPRQVLIVFGLFILSVILILANKYRAIGFQAMEAFTSPGTGDKFQYIVEWKQIGSLLGQPIWNLALLGLFIFLSSWKKNFHSWRIFPLLWLVVLWVLMQSYKFGVNFYFERLVFLAGVFTALFAAISIAKGVHEKKATLLLIFLFVSIMVVSGTDYMVTLFKASNKVGDDQLAALEILANRVKPTDVVFSNNNGVSQTRHDVIITDANITYYPSVQANCPVNDRICKSFASPGSKQAVDVLEKDFVQYILLLKPNYESNSDLDVLAKKYSIHPRFKILYTSNEAYVFQLATYDPSQKGAAL